MGMTTMDKLKRHVRQVPVDDGLRAPEGAVRLDAQVWLCNGSLKLVGSPVHEEDLPDLPEEDWHDCDEMGCGFEHVLAIVPVQ